MATREQAANARKLVQWWRRGGWKSSSQAHPRKRGPARGSAGARRELCELQRANRLQEAVAHFGGTVKGWARVPSRVVKVRLRRLG